MKSISKPYRWFFVFLGLSPISVGCFFAFFESCVPVLTFCGVNLNQFLGFGIGVLFCVVAFRLFCCWLNKILKEQDVTDISFTSITQKRSSLLSYSVVYVSPLILSANEFSVDKILLISIIFGLSTLFLEVEENNPIVRMSGYKFYEITSDGVTYLLMSKMNLTDLARIKGKPQEFPCIKFDDTFFIHTEN